MAAAAAVGCNSDNGTSSLPGGSTSDGLIKRGGIIAAHTTNDAPHMDIYRTNIMFQSSNGAGLAYSRLFRKKIGPDGLPGVINPEGDLVERLESPEPAVYVLHLHRGVRFHNLPPVNGRELVASDVVRSFERLRAERFNAGALDGLTKVTEIDQYTLRFDLDGPNVDFLVNLTDPHIGIMPHESWEGTGNVENGPIIGSGPWIFEEWKRNQVVRLRRNPDYFRPGLPYADGLEYWRISDPQTSFAALRTKQIHFLSSANRQTEKVLQSTDPSLVWAEGPLGAAQGGTKLWTHPDRAPTNDIRVRQAISKVINRKAQIDLAAFGGFLTAGVPVPDLSWILPESELNELIGTVDVAGAKQLASAANFQGWNPQLSAGPREMSATIPGVELTAADLRHLNINATIVPIDNILLNQDWNRGIYDMLNGGQRPEISPSIALEKFYKTGGVQNGYNISDPELDRLITQQKTLAGKPEERKQVIQAIQRRVIDQAMLIPVYTGLGGQIQWPFLKGFIADTNENGRFESAWLDL